MKIALHSGLNFRCVTSSPPVYKYFQCEIPCLSVCWLRSQSLFVTLAGCLDFSVVIDDTALIFCRIGSYSSLLTWGPLPSFQWVHTFETRAENYHLLFPECIFIQYKLAYWKGLLFSEILTDFSSFDLCSLLLASLCFSYLSRINTNSDILIRDFWLWS